MAKGMMRVCNPGEGSEVVVGVVAGVLSREK